MKTFETIRKAGHRLQPAEEALRSRITALLTHLTSQPPLDPSSMRSTQFQIQALSDAGRLDPIQALRHLSFDYPAALDGIMAVLAEQQKGIKALSECIIKDAKDLDVMHYGFQL